MDLFELREITLRCGEPSHYKIECDALTDRSLEALAALLAERLPPFVSVEGVPRGGLRLATFLLPHVRPDADGVHLLVDDVYTTGGRLEVQRGQRHEDPTARPILGAVLFARKPIVQPWIYGLFVLQGPVQLR